MIFPFKSLTLPACIHFYALQNIHFQVQLVIYKSYLFQVLIIHLSGKNIYSVGERKGLF